MYDNFYFRWIGMLPLVLLKLLEKKTYDYWIINIRFLLFGIFQEYKNIQICTHYTIHAHQKKELIFEIICHWSCNKGSSSVISSMKVNSFAFFTNSSFLFSLFLSSFSTLAQSTAIKWKQSAFFNTSFRAPFQCSSFLVLSFNMSC